MTTDAYVFAHSPTVGGDLDPSRLRGYAIADAYARFRRQRGDEVLFALGFDTLATAARPAEGQSADGWLAERRAALRAQLDRLDVSLDWGRALATDEAAVLDRAQWLIEQLVEAGRAYQRGEQWRLRTGPINEENERRLGELTGWSAAALETQRKLLEHVDDPGEDGSELEQSLSKLAAAGWKVEAKAAKKEPAVHFAAGDLPLSRDDGTPHPRLAAAVMALALTIPPDGRAGTRIDHLDARRWLPATLAVEHGGDAGQALLDVRTVAKALRDVGGLELVDGEPLGPTLLHGSLRFEGTSSSNGTVEAAQDATRSIAELIDAHGVDAVRFALLHAAAPAKAFGGGDDAVGYGAGFLAELRSFAEPRLAGVEPGARIDLDDGLRRRLAGWCDTAVGRAAENYEQLDLHRATRNAVALLARIQDFERRVVEHRGEVAGADRAAAGAAIAVLLQLLAPIAPRFVVDLWERAGGDGAAEALGWPGLQREPARA